MDHMIDAYTPIQTEQTTHVQPGLGIEHVACFVHHGPHASTNFFLITWRLEVGKQYAKTMQSWDVENMRKQKKISESHAFLFLWITQRGCKVASYKPEASRHHLSSSSPSTNSSSWLKETWQWNGSEKIYFLKVSNVHECCIIYLEGQSESFDTPPGMHATPGRKKASVVQRRKHPRASIIDARWVLVPCVASKNDFAWAQAEKDWKSESISVVKESRHSMGFAWP